MTYPLTRLIQNDRAVQMLAENGIAELDNLDRIVDENTVMLLRSSPDRRSDASS